MEMHEDQGKTFPLRIFREGEGGLFLHSRTGTWESHALCPVLEILSLAPRAEETCLRVEWKLRVPREKMEGLFKPEAPSLAGLLALTWVCPGQGGAKHLARA